ncbi:SRPBCC family protein [Salinactinospora qingdaonensis]|uniref:Polyketide cyclase / dehydrase and lipid transport n=1 Tax=Salinactinospora qingdaonensis TaxID=702744 RepID=A0ABP7EXP4_9ACTN
MHRYDIIDEAVIAAPPEKVWEALIAELKGAARWWVPHNTFAPNDVPPDQVGGEVWVTVHPNGVDKGGPKLRFLSRTRAVEPGARLTTDYVEGVFQGSGEFTLTPLNGGESTRLAMHFQVSPHGWVRLLDRIADIGQQHSKATQAAFANLNTLLSEERTTERSQG